MIAKPWSIGSFLYDRDIDIEERLTIFFIDMGIIAAVLGTLICACAHSPWYGVLATGFIAVGASVVMAGGYLFKRTDKVGLIIALCLPLIISVVWVFNGGSSGGVNVWLVYVIYYISLFASRKELIAFVIYTAICIACCFAIEGVHPEIVFHYAAGADTYISVVGSIIVVSVTIIITTLIQKDLYVKEKMASDAKEKTTLDFVTAVADIVDAKDRYTSRHSNRVAVAAREIARKLGLSDEQVQDIYAAGLLHDIGKIGVPDTILNKPGRLTDAEYQIIKQHTIIGGDLLHGMGFLGCAYDCALHHHERWDGKGYPDELAGEAIPRCARIMAVADSYDAMSMNRVYRAHLSDEEIVAEFKKCAGTQFDPEIASVFLEMLEDGFAIPEEEETAPGADSVLSEKARMMLDAIVSERNMAGDDPLEQMAIGGTSRDFEPVPLVEHSEFVHMYRYIEDLCKRQNSTITLIKITVGGQNNSELSEGRLGHAMTCLSRAIQQLLRSVDVCTPYGEDSFLVAMIGADESNVEGAVNRVFGSFYNIYGESDAVLSFEFIENPANR